jgi:two-component system, OmpR family, osmolarity sensor histidine kinase EnvZ
VLKTLLSRNIALMAIIVVLSQIMTVTLVGVFIVKPQADRLAVILARNIAVLSTTVDALPPDERDALITRVNANGTVRILRGTAPPVAAGGSATLLERQVLHELARNLGRRDELNWRGGGAMPLWVRLKLGPNTYWVSVASPVGWTPDGAIAASFVLALTMALAAGIMLQRRINKPLRALAASADRLPVTAIDPELADHGPSEVMAVARSFNAMASRLAEQEQNRTLMLAGISHDLKTPLAKIRLGLAIDPSSDPDIAAMFERETGRMERMLDQFLDFARGIDNEAPMPVAIGPALKNGLAAVDMRSHPEIEGPPDVRIAVRPMAFERTLINLLRNADIHGAPPFRVAVTIDRMVACIAISDSGPGVPSEMVEKLAHPFFRASEARPSDGGVGLGLTIASRFAADHGGSLTVQNGEQGGLVVTLLLPVDSAP